MYLPLLHIHEILQISPDTASSWLLCPVGILPVCQEWDCLGWNIMLNVDHYDQFISSSIVADGGNCVILEPWVRWWDGVRGNRGPVLACQIIDTSLNHGTQHPTSRFHLDWTQQTVFGKLQQLLVQPLRKNYKKIWRCKAPCLQISPLWSKWSNKKAQLSAILNRSECDETRS